MPKILTYTLLLGIYPIGLLKYAQKDPKMFTAALSVTAPNGNNLNIHYK